MDHEPHNLLQLTTTLIRELITADKVEAGDLPEAIAKTYAALAATAGPAPSAVAPAPVPAVPASRSIKPDHLVCLEDGAKLKMLKRYLRTNFGMTPEEYRAKWGLPKDYPMVAPNYAETRRALAVKIGLGRKDLTPTPQRAPDQAQGRKAA